MPPPRRRKRRSYRPFMVLVGAGAVVAVGVMVVIARQRSRQLADESFQRAEELFRGVAFVKAQREYELFARDYPDDDRVAEAQAAAELSKLAQSLDDDLTDPDRVVRRLDKFWSESRSAPGTSDRWPVVVSQAERRARSQFERTQRTLEGRDLDAGQVWLTWLRTQQAAHAPGADSLALADLDKLSKQATEQIAAAGRRRGFVEAAERAMTQGQAADFTLAFRAFDHWRAGSKTPDPSISELYERLRQALRSRVRFVPPPQESAEIAPSPPRLPVEAYTRVSMLRQAKPVTLATAAPVFVRAKDLCFGIDSASGTPDWVLRVGYDAPVPQVVSNRSRPAVLVSWFDGTEPVVSLCDAANGECLWSWHAPDTLTGPPAVARDSVFAATVGGAVWQLDLQNGTPRAVAELPEPIDSPPALSDDGRGLCVVGARQGVYLFDVARDVPVAIDTVLAGRRSDTACCQAMWTPPYVVVFENDRMNRSYVRVLFQGSSGYESVREVELDGRVWQPPVLDGADLFLMTDRWRSYCFGLDPGNSAVNLYTVAQVPVTDPVRQPVLPHFARAGNLPFVALSDALRAYRVDRSRALLIETWSRPLPQLEARGVQPLQVVEGVVVATFQEADSDGVRVQAISTQNGELIWETRLANAARDLAVADHPDTGQQVVARIGSGSMFLLARTGTSGESQSPAASGGRASEHASDGWLSVSLDLPRATSPVQFDGDGRTVAYFSDAGTRLCVASTRDWKPMGQAFETPPASSPLTLYEGPLVVTAPDVTERPAGRWAFFVTAARAIEVRRLDGGDDDIHGVRMPAVSTHDELWTWAPLVLNGEHILVAHPQGVVCRAEVRRLEGIAHLFPTAHRTDLPRLAAPPIALGTHVLCVGRDGHCLLLDPATLRTVHDWQAPGPIDGGVAAVRNQVFLGLEGPRLQAVRNDRMELLPVWQRPVEDGDWQVAGVVRGFVIVVDSGGRMLALDAATGQTVWSHTAPAPLAVPPVSAGDEIVLATIDGGVYFVPGPEAR